MPNTLDAIEQFVESQVEPRSARWLRKVIDGCLYLAIILIPLFFLPNSLDILELNKQSLLAVLMGVGLLAWLARTWVLKAFRVSSSWLHIVVAVFVGCYMLTSIFSLDRYLSLVGNIGQMQWSFVSIFLCAIAYFLLVNTIRGTTKLYHFMLAFLASSVLVGLYGIAQLVGWFPLGFLGEFAQAKTFNTIGTINSLGVYMTVPLILAASLTVLGCKDQLCILGQEGKRSLAAKILVWVSLVVSTVVAIMVNYWVVWASILFGTVLLVVLPILRERRFERNIKLTVPGTLIVLSVLLLLFKAPFALSLPAEVSPSTLSSWSVAKETLRHHPLFGSGPGTWMYDYAKYRQVAVNMSPFWNIRFERGSSTLLSLLAMIGVVGTALWLALVLAGFIRSASHLIIERNDDAWQAYLTVFTSWATLVFIAFVYNYNVSHQFAFWFLFGLLASLIARRTWVWRRTPAQWLVAVLGLATAVLAVALVSGLWLTGQRLVAEAKYASAIRSFQHGQKIQGSIDLLQDAIVLNPWNDGYYRNLSQAYLLRASDELKAPADADRSQKVDMSVTAAVARARKATDVGPNNVDNWTNLAVVLQSIASFTRGADEKSIEMFQQAAEREPNNPSFNTEIGKLHILRSDAYRQLLQSQDEKVRKDAEQHIGTELDQAADALNQAIQSKQDYAPAHYALGLVYERQGRLQDAMTKLEQVLRNNPKDVGVAFQLAILYYRHDDKEKSLNVLEQIVAFDPSYVNARWYLASLYEERSRYDDAITQVQKVLELNPDNQVVANHLKELIALRDAHARPPASPLPEPVQDKINSPTNSGSVKK